MSEKISLSKPLVELLHSDKDNGMSRRDALKLMGLTGGSAMMLGAPTKAEAGPSSDKKVKVLVVGGGAVVLWPLQDCTQHFQMLNLQLSHQMRYTCINQGKYL
jgi:hypothetical protein